MWLRDLRTVSTLAQFQALVFLKGWLHPERAARSMAIAFLSTRRGRRSGVGNGLQDSAAASKIGRGPLMRQAASRAIVVPIAGGLCCAHTLLFSFASVEIRL